MSESKLPHNHGECEIENEIISRLECEHDFSTVADKFKLLDDATGLKIFWILCHTEECVINISAMLNMTSPAVSHHLRKLKAGGIITSRREGKEVYYKSAGTKEAKCLHETIEKMMEINCPRGKQNEKK